MARGSHAKIAAAVPNQTAVGSASQSIFLAWLLCCWMRGSKSAHGVTPCNRCAAPPAAAGGAEDPYCSGGWLLVDERRTGGADHLVLRAGAAGAADGADDLAVLDQRNAAARGDHVIEGHDVFQVDL